MYAPSQFKPDRSANLAFAASRAFGTVSAWDGQKPVASPVPFCLEYADDGTPQLAFHLARRNPLIGLAGGQATWMMSVMNADAYVSANWYASPDQVPTWLYTAVHLTGPVRVMPDNAMEAHLDTLSAHFENSLPEDERWTTRKMTAARLEALKKAIVGLVMSVDEIEGSFKLNQHKSDADHVAVAAALSRQGDAGSQAIATRMVALRPRLHYMSDAQVSEGEA